MNRSCIILGWPLKKVRVWTNYTKKGRQCETKPHMNGDKSGVWNESFTLPVLKHQRRMVLVFEVTFQSTFLRYMAILRCHS
jgi:hypothetical protein